MEYYEKVRLSIRYCSGPTFFFNLLYFDLDRIHVCGDSLDVNGSRYSLIF